MESISHKIHVDKKRVCVRECMMMDHVHTGDQGTAIFWNVHRCEKHLLALSTIRVLSPPKTTSLSRALVTASCAANTAAFLTRNVHRAHTREARSPTADRTPPPTADRTPRTASCTQRERQEPTALANLLLLAGRAASR